MEACRTKGCIGDAGKPGSARGLCANCYQLRRRLEKRGIEEMHIAVAMEERAEKMKRKKLGAEVLVNQPFVEAEKAISLVSEIVQRVDDEKPREVAYTLRRMSRDGIYGWVAEELDVTVHGRSIIHDIDAWPVCAERLLQRLRP